MAEDATLVPDRGIASYDGAADTGVAQATGSLRELLAWLDRQGRAP